MPIDRGLIDQQLQALGDGAQWWDQRELRDLPAVLDAGERILAVSRGKIARVRWLRRSWLIVVTDRRLLCLQSAGRTGWRQLEVSAAQFTRVALRIGVFRGRILLTAGGQTYRLLMPRTDAYRLEATLASLIPRVEAPGTGFGPTRMVRRVVDHVLALPAVAFDPGVPVQRPSPAPVDTLTMRRCDLLEEQVQELQRQVEFLEQLLRERQGAAASARDP